MRAENTRAALDPLRSDSPHESRFTLPLWFDDYSVCLPADLWFVIRLVPYAA